MELDVDWRDSCSQRFRVAEVKVAQQHRDALTVRRFFDPMDAKEQIIECISGQRRSAVVAAHPDDETIGLGARLAALRASAFILVTDGAPENPADARAAGFSTRADYAAARIHEIEQVLSRCKIDRWQLHALHLTDQRVSFTMEELARRLALLLTHLDPQAVITHPYEGGHPDHDATALAVHGACRLIERTRGAAPLIIEMTSYHRSGDRLQAETFLPRLDCEALIFDLNEKERCGKKQLIDCYVTQKQTLSSFPLEREAFRIAPHYDFSRPPHHPPLLYDSFGWEMTSARWPELARAAVKSLEAR